MSRATAILLLLLAAALEAGGDAIIRAGLHKNLLWQKTLLFVLAGVVLFAYGWTVNSPSWYFGKLLGLYVVSFFLTAQILSFQAGSVSCSYRRRRVYRSRWRDYLNGEDVACPDNCNET
jgi:hypothetical protein